MQRKQKHPTLADALLRSGKASPPALRTQNIRLGGDTLLAVQSGPDTQRGLSMDLPY